MGFISLPAEEIERYLWVNKPSAANSEGEIIYVTDIGPNGSHWISNGSYWSPLNGEATLAQSGASVSVTGTTTETVLATYTLPANLVAPWSTIEIFHNWSYTNSANSKTLRLKHAAVGGGITGDTYYSCASTTTATLQAFSAIRCNNSMSLQKGWGIGSTGPGGFGTISSTLRAFTRGLTSASDINLTAQLANTGETITLTGYSIVLKG